MDKSIYSQAHSRPPNSDIPGKGPRNLYIKKQKISSGPLTPARFEHHQANPSIRSFPSLPWAVKWLQTQSHHLGRKVADKTSSPGSSWGVAGQGTWKAQCGPGREQVLTGGSLLSSPCACDMPCPLPGQCKQRMRQSVLSVMKIFSF